MAVYRENSPSRLPLLIGGIVAALAIVVVIALALRPQEVTPPSAGKTNLVTTLNTIAVNLDVFKVEYAKVSSGTPALQTGSLDAIQRALKTLVEQRAPLSTLDDEALAVLEKDLTAIAAALQKSPVADQIPNYNDAMIQLEKLRTVLNQRK